MTNSNTKLKIKNAPHGFCLAKWYQVTIDLTQGTNHSCHHPERHLIPLEEIKNNPASLHNTQFKKTQRKMMLNGERPPECVYCWNIEDTPGNELQSDRYIKSTDDWAISKLDATLLFNGDENVAPTYLEIMFSSQCNLSCIYCMADVSSSIDQEIKKFGPYPVLKNHEHRISKSSPIPENNNPYIEAFWEYLPKIAEQLEYFRITGGEPLLSNDTFKVLEYFEKNPNPKLNLSINTNLSYGTKVLEKLISHLKVLESKKCIKQFSIFVSLDGFGSQASFIRQNLNLHQFFKNLDLFVNHCPHSPIVIMCTFNILSIHSFPELLDWLAMLKKKGIKITLDISYLKDPEYLRANLVTNDLKELLAQSLLKMERMPEFTNYEKSKLSRVVNWIISTSEDKSLERKIIENRADFYRFINEFNSRYQQNFLEIFPQYKNFYAICMKSALWTKF